MNIKHKMESLPEDVYQFDPEALIESLDVLMSLYQKQPVALFARAIANIAYSLFKHPEVENNAYDSCNYSKLYKHWDWLANNRQYF